LPCVVSDVRRLIVAMSRARLGLYVFARVALFQNCFELTPAFNQLMVRPLRLFLAPHETYPPVRKVHSCRRITFYHLLFDIIIWDRSLGFLYMARNAAWWPMFGIIL